MDRIMPDHINKWVSEEEIVALMRELIRRPSHPGVENQETAVAEYIHEFFSKEGIKSELLPVQEGRKNVTAVIKGKGIGKNLLLTGHTDTVPPYDMPDAFELRPDGNHLIGRGSNDMKGPLACMIMAMIAIKRAGIQLDGDLMFAGVIDEEEKSLGTIDLIERGIKADGAIVGEPTDLDICIAHRGLEWFEFDFEGKAVHGGKQKEGINAILKASNFIQLMENKIVPLLDNRKHPLTGTSTMNYGTIKGGTQPSTVAGNCKIQIDRRWIPGEKYEDILQEYEDALVELREKDPEFKCNMTVMDVSVMKEGYVHEAMEIDRDHKLVEALLNASEEISEHRPAITYFTAWSDGGLLNHYAKISTLVCGPGDLETAHSKDEFINIKQLIPAVKIYVLTALKFCGNS
ncbi:MAG: Acetylornithine deacetylase [Clostridiales bacterium 38_11]|nr:MAG: Acetylornithine deacetylase [Clostridiales bacterium 38_11]HBH13668.1 acetylornithine deacetylase [Clostridiales bacterium]